MAPQDIAFSPVYRYITMNVCQQQEMQRELEALSYMDGSEEDNASPESCWNSKHDNWNPFSLGCWCVTNFP